MLSKEIIKAINTIVPKKLFTPALNNLMYYKELNTFVATDSYILLEIKNPFDQFESDFCISGIDIKTIKNDIIAMSLDRTDQVNIITKDKDYIFKVKKDLRQPEYKRVLEQFKIQAHESICNSQTYIKFFEVANNLELEKIEF
jgi:hypothetical protein